MAKSVSFDNAQDWEEYYYSQGRDFVFNNRELADECSVCRCIRDNSDYIIKSKSIIKNRQSFKIKGVISRYSCFNLQTKKDSEGNIVNYEKAMSFHWLEHKDWNVNWESFKTKYKYILYLKFLVSKIRGIKVPLDQTDQDLECNEVSWELFGPNLLQMNVLPSPTKDGEKDESTHVSLFSFTNSELISGENFGRFEGEIKIYLKEAVEHIYDVDQNITENWTIEDPSEIK